MMDPERIVDLLILGAVFLLFFSAWLAVLIARGMRSSAQKEKIEGRLGLRGDGAGGGERTLSLWLDTGKVTTTVEDGKRRSLFDRLETMHLEAGWKTPLPSLVLVIGLLVFFCLAASVVLIGTFIPGVFAGLGVVATFWFSLKRAIAKRESVFEQQLVDALDLASRSLRAGHPLAGAFRLIAEEVPPPVSGVFAEICQQQNLGLTLEEAIKQVAAKNTSGDFHLFATSVAIQLRSGGNLADMMERLAAVIRDRMRLARRVRVLTAQTQFSKRVLLVLPFVIFAVLHVINSDYMSAFYTRQLGHLMLVAGACGLALGAYVMNKLAVLRY